MNHAVCIQHTMAHTKTWSMNKVGKDIWQILASYWQLKNYIFLTGNSWKSFSNPCRKGQAVAMSQLCKTYTCIFWHFHLRKYLSEKSDFLLNTLHRTFMNHRLFKRRRKKSKHCTTRIQRKDGMSGQDFVNHAVYNGAYKDVKWG